MLQNIPNKTYRVGHQDFSLEFNSTHTLQAIRSGSVMVSMFETPVSEKALSNIFMRVKKADGFDVTPLLFF